jgi:acyl-CoA synthetase (AMP-forming)/AMP-acid ligase II
MKLTPMQALMHQVHTQPQSTAFVFHEDVWTYERLASAAARLARALAARGVKAGNRVALHMMNRPEMIVAYYACFQLGAIAAPLRTAFTAAELVTLLRRLGPTLYLGEMNLYHNVDLIHDAILPQERRFVLDAARDDVDVQPWELLFEGADNEPSFASSDLKHPAVLINTSGTTGQPKFVMHSADTLRESVRLIVDHWGVSDNGFTVEALSLARAGGLITFLTWIDLGRPFVLLESFDAEAVLDAMQRYRCTVYIGMPAQYAALLDLQRTQPRDLSSLRHCLTAADVCPLDLQSQVSSTFNAPLCNVWGATEVLGSLTYGLKPGPVARVAKGAETRLIDESGAEVPHGKVGELLVRGPNVFDGYWNDTRATEEALEGGWYHTGDLMRRGEGDELWFVARKKDIIIRGGTNISPIEVEEALVACHPAVEEAAVVGVPDRVLGQRVFGFVRLADGIDDIVLPGILENVRTRLAAYKVPENIRILQQLPRNALGKVDRNMLQTLASDSPTIVVRMRERKRQIAAHTQRIA